jgi:hypothetical protein
MPFCNQIFANSTKLKAFLLCLLMASGCSNEAPDPKDIGLLYEACKSMKSKDGQTACLNSLTKVAGKKSIEAIPKKPNPGIAKEEITFKGIPFDQPNQADKLIALCVETKDNLERISYGTKHDNKCKLRSDKSLWFQVSYGSMDEASLSFQLNDAGALVNVNTLLSSHKVLPLVIVLTAKYGDPQIKNDEIANGLGNKFDRQIFSWIDQKGNRITIHSRYEKVNQGYFEIESASESEKIFEKTIENISKGQERL